MKNFDRPFGIAARVVGPTIRNLGEKLGFSVYELRNAITNSMSDYGCPYADETVNGFLHGRPWPKVMTRDTTIEIVGHAFEQILIDQNKRDKIPEAKGTLDFMLNNLCESYEKEEINNALKKIVTEFVFKNEAIEYNPFLNKYFKACCSGKQCAGIYPAHACWWLPPPSPRKERRNCAALFKPPSASAVTRRERKIIIAQPAGDHDFSLFPSCPTSAPHCFLP